jgi:hypothetical protein
MMIHGVGVSNEVYNAAANVTTAVLGEPEGLTARIRARFGAGAHVRRYMLAARDVTGDNEVSARFLSRPLQAIARGKLRGASPDTVQAMREILFLEQDPDGRRHWSKTGELDTDPMTRIRSGFQTLPDGRVVVYVVMGQLPDTGGEPRGEVAQRLGASVAELTDGILRAALR